MPYLSDPFRRAQVATGALFCFLGFQYGSWVSRVPSLQDRLDLDDREVGLLLLAPGVGAAVSFAAVAWLMRRLGSRRLATCAALALLAVLAVLPVAVTYPLALVILLGDGVAVACLNVAMNAQAAALEARYQRTTMAKLHAVFSAGVFSAALLASAATAVSRTLAVHFTLAGLILVLLLIAATTGTAPADRHPAAPAAGERGRLRGFVPSLTAVVLTLAMVLAELTEGAMNDWSALYLRDVAHAAPALTPLGIAVVSAVMLVARVFADGWRKRWGDKRVVVAGVAVASGGLGSALLLGGAVPAFAGFACVGLGMAAVTPCLYVAAARLGPQTLALVASAGTVGLLAGPPLIGFVAHAAGLVWGMSVVVIAALALAACVGPVRWPAEERAPAGPGAGSADRAAGLSGS
ncbi:MFS transporter [Actinoplanes teichomyceticus]|uniref:Fucose permease n=1 Tax=Actinoplanes teichomyceticus TaxID=1867 RepID=A0A561WKQ7_ACTTI|nr:MFS transporter [Actinoplanes teichomyceticus]TWG24452.1 fucose permease [Actinoplanes teichomyceticus]GIF12697.1 MFS transporter [Actinoplanes teichomyceticus]